MLTTGEAITAVIRESMNPGSDVYSYDEELRWRCRLSLTKVAQDLFHYAPFWWKRGNGTVPLTSGVGTLPADFNSFGTHGAVYVSGTSEPLGYLPSDELFAMLTTSPSAGRPSAYTLADVDGSGLPKLYCYPTDNSTLLIKQYDRKVPELIDCPTPPTVAVSADAGSPTGTYRYRVTFVTDLGESEGGFVSDEATAAGNLIDLSAIPLSPARSVTARNIYRTEDGGVQYKLVATIPDNLTTTGLDDVADVDLGVNVPTPASALYTGLEIFPADFHESVLLEGLRQRMSASVGDPREFGYSEEWRRKVRVMWADQKPGQNQGWAMPAYGATVWGDGGNDYWRERISR